MLPPLTTQDTSPSSLARQSVVGERVCSGNWLGKLSCWPTFVSSFCSFRQPLALSPLSRWQNRAGDRPVQLRDNKQWMDDDQQTCMKVPRAMKAMERSGVLWLSLDRETDNSPFHTISKLPRPRFALNQVYLGCMHSSVLRHLSQMKTNLYGACSVEDPTRRQSSTSPAFIPNIREAAAFSQLKRALALSPPGPPDSPPESPLHQLYISALCIRVHGSISTGLELRRWQIW